MEFKIDDLAGLLEGELLRTLVDGSILMRIGGNEHNVKILRSGTSEFEFILDNIFHHVKVLGTSSAEARLIVDGQHMNIRKHSKLTEVLEKSSTLIGTAGRDRNLISQIPGRVVSLPAKAGSEVKKGDIMIIIESM